MKYSYECSELIKELKADMEEFGADTMIYVWCKEKAPGVTFFTSYDFIEDDLPITADEIKTMQENDEHLEVMTMGILLPLLEKQNEIL